MSECYNENYFSNYDMGGIKVDYKSFQGLKDIMVRVANHIVQDFNPSSVLDVGCALGFLVEALRDLGVEAYGTDVSAYAIDNVREDIRQYCAVSSIVTDSLPEAFPKKYDLVICIEVIEHLFEEECMTAIEKLCSYGDRVIISSTSDDIEDETHFNVQQPEYWVKRFAKFGFYNQLNYKPDYISPASIYFKRFSDLPRVIENYERKIRIDLIEKNKIEADNDALLADNDANKQRISEIDNENEKLQIQLREEKAGFETQLREERARYEVQLREVNIVYEKELQKHLEQLEACRNECSIYITQMSAIEKSSFWRLTKPLRMIIDCMKKVLRKGSSK